MTTHSITDSLDLPEPIWTIEHVAHSLHLSVDAAREYAYRADFLAARAGFARNPWLREEVPRGFAGLRAPATPPGGAPRPPSPPASAGRPRRRPAPARTSHRSFGIRRAVPPNHSATGPHRRR